MKEFNLYQTVLFFLLILVLLALSNYDGKRIKDIKEGITVYKKASNLRYNYEDESDVKTIIAVINNAKKTKRAYEEVEKEYKNKIQYEIWFQHASGGKSGYHLWLDEDKPVLTECQIIDLILFAILSRTLFGENQLSKLIAVNFPTIESDILQQAKSVNSKEYATNVTKGGTNLRDILIITALIIMALEWICYVKISGK